MFNKSAIVACVLSTLFSITGCSSLPKVVTAAELCRDWRHQTISKNDKLTQGTASQIEASNESRVVWGCDRKANKAASS